MTPLAPPIRWETGIRYERETLGFVGNIKMWSLCGDADWARVINLAGPKVTHEHNNIEEAKAATEKTWKLWWEELYAERLADDAKKKPCPP